MDLSTAKGDVAVKCIMCYVTFPNKSALDSHLPCSGTPLDLTRVKSEISEEPENPSQDAYAVDDRTDSDDMECKRKPDLNLTSALGVARGSTCTSAGVKVEVISEEEGDLFINPRPFSPKIPSAPEHIRPVLTFRGRGTWGLGPPGVDRPRRGRGSRGGRRGRSGSRRGMLSYRGRSRGRRKSGPKPAYQGFFAGCDFSDIRPKPRAVPAPNSSIIANNASGLRIDGVFYTDTKDVPLSKELSRNRTSLPNSGNTMATSLSVLTSAQSVGTLSSVPSGAVLPNSFPLGLNLGTPVPNLTNLISMQTQPMLGGAPILGIPQGGVQMDLGMANRSPQKPICSPMIAPSQGIAQQLTNYNLGLNQMIPNQAPLFNSGLQVPGLGSAPAVSPGLRQKMPILIGNQIMHLDVMLPTSVSQGSRLPVPNIGGVIPSPSIVGVAAAPLVSPNKVITPNVSIAASASNSDLVISTTETNVKFKQTRSNLAAGIKTHEKSPEGDHKRPIAQQVTLATSNVSNAASTTASLLLSTPKPGPLNNPVTPCSTTFSTPATLPNLVKSTTATSVMSLGESKQAAPHLNTDDKTSDKSPEKSPPTCTIQTHLFSPVKVSTPNSSLPATCPVQLDETPSKNSNETQSNLVTDGKPSYQTLEKTMKSDFESSEGLVSTSPHTGPILQNLSQSTSAHNSVLDVSTPPSPHSPLFQDTHGNTPLTKANSDIKMAETGTGASSDKMCKSKGRKSQEAAFSSVEKHEESKSTNPEVGCVDMDKHDTLENVCRSKSHLDFSKPEDKSTNLIAHGEPNQEANSPCTKEQSSEPAIEGPGKKLHVHEEYPETGRQSRKIQMKETPKNVTTTQTMTKNTSFVENAPLASPVKSVQGIVGPCPPQSSGLNFLPQQASLPQAPVFRPGFTLPGVMGIQGSSGMFCLPQAGQMGGLLLSAPQIPALNQNLWVQNIVGNQPVIPQLTPLMFGGGCLPFQPSMVPLPTTVSGLTPAVGLNTLPSYPLVKTDSSSSNACVAVPASAQPPVLISSMAAENVDVLGNLPSSLAEKSSSETFKSLNALNSSINVGVVEGKISNQKKSTVETGSTFKVTKAYDTKIQRQRQVRYKTVQQLIQEAKIRKARRRKEGELRIMPRPSVAVEISSAKGNGGEAKGADKSNITRMSSTMTGNASSKIVQPIPTGSHFRDSVVGEVSKEICKSEQICSNPKVTIPKAIHKNIKRNISHDRHEHQRIKSYTYAFKAVAAFSPKPYKYKKIKSKAYAPEPFTACAPPLKDKQKSSTDCDSTSSSAGSLATSIEMNSAHCSAAEQNPEEQSKLTTAGTYSTNFIDHNPSQSSPLDLSLNCKQQEQKVTSFETPVISASVGPALMSSSTLSSFYDPATGLLSKPSTTEAVTKTTSSSAHSKDGEQEASASVTLSSLYDPATGLLSKIASSKQGNTGLEADSTTEDPDTTTPIPAVLPSQSGHDNDKNPMHPLFLGPLSQNELAKILLTPAALQKYVSLAQGQMLNPGSVAIAISSAPPKKPLKKLRPVVPHTLSQTCVAPSKNTQSQLTSATRVVSSASLQSTPLVTGEKLSKLTSMILSASSSTTMSTAVTTAKTSYIPFGSGAPDPPLSLIQSSEKLSSGLEQIGNPSSLQKTSTSMKNDRLNPDPVAATSVDAAKSQNEIVSNAQALPHSFSYKVPSVLPTASASQLQLGPKLLPANPMDKPLPLPFIGAAASAQSQSAVRMLQLPVTSAWSPSPTLVRMPFAGLATSIASGTIISAASAAPDIATTTCGMARSWLASGPAIASVSSFTATPVISSTPSSTVRSTKGTSFGLSVACIIASPSSTVNTVCGLRVADKLSTSTLSAGGSLYTPVPQAPSTSLKRASLVPQRLEHRPLRRIMPKSSVLPVVVNLDNADTKKPTVGPLQAQKQRQNYATKRKFMSESRKQALGLAKLSFLGDLDLLKDALRPTRVDLPRLCLPPSGSVCVGGCIPENQDKADVAPINANTTVSSESGREHFTTEKSSLPREGVLVQLEDTETLAKKEGSDEEYTPVSKRRRTGGWTQKRASQAQRSSLCRRRRNYSFNKGSENLAGRSGDYSGLVLSSEDYEVDGARRSGRINAKPRLDYAELEKKPFQDFEESDSDSDFEPSTQRFEIVTENEVDDAAIKSMPFISTEMAISKKFERDLKEGCNKVSEGSTSKLDCEHTSLISEDGFSKKLKCEENEVKTAIAQNEHDEGIFFKAKGVEAVFEPETSKTRSPKDQIAVPEGADEDIEFNSAKFQSLQPDPEVYYSSESESDMFAEESESSQMTPLNRQKLMLRRHREVTMFLVKHAEKFTLLEDSDEHYCKVCGKYKTNGVFKLSSHLKKHIAGSLKCQLCEYEAFRKEDLESHIMKLH